MKKIAVLILALMSLTPQAAHAQGAAPELFNVKEVILQYARFMDAKASDTCGLSRDKIAETVLKELQGTGVPITPVIDAKPPVLGVARIDLIPIISTRTDENLDCTSWISFSAENRVNAVIPPVTTLRTVTVVYWRQSIVASSSQSTHPIVVSDAIKKSLAQFAQQYRLDQPPEISGARPASR